jgi:hypothetical protein
MRAARPLHTTHQAYPRLSLHGPGRRQCHACTMTSPHEPPPRVGCVYLSRGAGRPHTHHAVRFVATSRHRLIRLLGTRLFWSTMSPLALRSLGDHVRLTVCAVVEWSLPDAASPPWCRVPAQARRLAPVPPARDRDRPQSLDAQQWPWLR